MLIFKEIAALRRHLNGKRSRSVSIGLVPTMGALHQGHLSLIHQSKKASDLTVCSLFVNPTQFNNASDLANYPRTFDEDSRLLESAGCDVLFAPEAGEMYDTTSSIRFDFGDLDKVLEGKFRPGHFSGVATVVSKLFNIIQPDHAFFGRKDYQQLQIITRLTNELKFNIHLHPVDTVRESSGLAMSSRNQRLTDDQRQKASAIYQNLSEARQSLLGGTSWNSTHEKVLAALNSIEGFRVEYFELVEKNDLTRAADSHPNDGVLLIACYVGEVRLIDNLLI